MTSDHRDIDHTLRADTEALRQTSQRRLHSLANVLDGLNNRSTKKGFTMKQHNKRWLRLAVAATILAAAGVVFAATSTSLFSVWVDTEGKTDQQVEDEIHDQLLDQGVLQPEVEFKRTPGQTEADIAGEKDGRQFRIVHKHKGDGDPGVVRIEPPRLDTEREPGMTDAELEAKVQAQLDELGLDAKVKVKGDDIEIRAEKRVEECAGESCPDPDDSE